VTQGSENFHGRSSIVIRRRVIPGAEIAYEQLLKGLLEDAKPFPGYLGSQVVRPTPEDPDYHITLHFDGPENQEAWAVSEERCRWVEPMKRLAEEPRIEILSGLETWFTVPAGKHRGPPSKHKMTFVTWTVIFPVVFFYSELLRQVPVETPAIISVFIVTALTVPTAAYLVLPRMTRVFEKWLFPKPS
jgi:uncharacterized protein